MIPKYKIETYTGAVLDHTITSKAILRFKEVLTDSVGTFRFTVPTKENGTYEYDDIALYDKIKLYVGYDAVPANPNFIGRVTRISAPMNIESGYVRHISGLSQGEILLRRFKTDKAWDSTEVDDIVNEVATDLTLGAGDIEVDATAITYEVETKRYFDLLKDISDFWVNAGTQIKKDFYIDVDNDLVWASRDGTAPFRTGASVETLTVGQNLLNYEVTKDVDSVKNDITVYGAQEKGYPTDMDSPTETTTGWTALSGVVTRNDVGERKGTYYIRCEHNPGTTCSFYYSHTKLKNYGKLVFWAVRGSVGNTTKKVRILAPDTTNYFEAEMDDTNSPNWTINELTLGKANEYDVDHNPNGEWTKSGTPRWYDMQGVWFYHVGTDPAVWGIDGDFGYLFGRYSYNTTDGTSQTSYGQRDYEMTDDRLHSDSECEQRAKTLLYQLKDPPTQIEATITGNNNVLVGDRLSMTIPAEGISAANYDVISVEHLVTDENWLTIAVMTDSASIRAPIKKNQAQMLRDVQSFMRNLAIDHNVVH